MNFIQHTRAAHDQLRQQPAATPFHVSLYWALFFEWNAHRFPDWLALDHEQLMHTAHIGNRRTYRATLYDLDTWGLLTYQPSRSRHQPSRCYLARLSGAEQPQVAPPTQGTNAPSEAGVTRSTSAPSKSALPGAEVPPVLELPGAEVPPLLLIGTKRFTKSKPTLVVNSDASSAKKKKGPAALPDEELSAVYVFTPDLPADDPDATPKKKVALKKKGVRAETIRAAATASLNEPRQRGPLPELPFRQSFLYDFTAFTAAFAGTDYALADLRHYHQLIDNWRDKKTGLPPLRRDWIATSKKFMLNDATDNRLKLAPHVHHVDGHGTGQSKAGIPSTGYRSSRYD